MRSLAAEATATVIERCRYIHVHDDLELELGSACADGPSAVVASVGRAIASVEEHTFPLGPASSAPIVNVRRLMT